MFTSRTFIPSLLTSRGCFPSPILNFESPLIKLTRFCVLSNLTPHPLPSHVLLTCNMKLNGIPNKIACKMHAYFTLDLKFWRYLLQKVTWCNHSFCLLLFYLAFIYISICDFLHVFRTSFTIIGKNVSAKNSTFSWIHPNSSPLLTAKICQVWPKIFVVAP